MNMLFDNFENKIFLGKYKTEKLLGEGSFGKIYEATDINTNEKYALKFEDRYNGQNLLEFEASAIGALKGFGIPQMKTFGYSGENNILVLELLGKSLENLFQENNAKFSLKTVCMLAIQMLDRIQFIHSHHVIHRDIKPDNFLIGKNNYGEKIVYLIDFGLCKRFINKKTFQHVKFSNNHKLTGTARYASINALKGYEQSRRDDIEAIGYVLLYFLRGSLPWQGLKMNKKDDKFKKIYEVKKNTSTEELCKGYPEEFLEYMNYSKNLHFEENPDYNYLRGLFKSLMEKNNYVYDLDFDWILNAKLKLSQEKEKEKSNVKDGQIFNMISLKNDKQNIFTTKPQPIILNKITLDNPINNKINNKENQNLNGKIESKPQFPNKIEIVDNKTLGKSLVDMVKNEKNQYNYIDEKIDRILHKEGTKKVNKKLAGDNTDNSKSNYLNSFYSLETKETREDHQTVSSKYKLCSLNSNKIEYKKKNYDYDKDLIEIPEDKEESLVSRTKTRVYTGMKYVYDRCEIL